MNSIKITFFKELRSIFRDKKTILVLFLFPFLIPAIIILYAEIYNMENDDKTYLVGIDYEMSSVEVNLFDESNLKAKVYKNKKEMEKAYSKGDIFGYIDYDEGNHKYYVYVNEDDEDGMYVHSYVSAYFDSYNRYLGDLTLIGEDIDIDKAYDNFSYEMVHLDGNNWMLSLMFSMAFTYIVMAIVMATTNMATTSTAVEKENGTLETLLTFPIKTLDLIFGKYLATVFMGIISSVMGLVLAVGGLLYTMKFYDVFEGISFSVSFGNMFLAILIVILASFFIGGIAMLLTSNAKSYKEAQSISSFLNMITIIPMFISMFNISVSKLYYFVPIFNYTQILMDIFSGIYDYLAILIVIVSSIVYVFVIIRLIVSRYHTEKVLF